MTGLVYTEITSGGPIPLETTIIYEATVTCSTTGDSYSSVADVFNYQVVRDWSCWLDSSPGNRARRCIEGAEEDYQSQEKLKRIRTYDSFTLRTQEGVISSKNNGIQLEIQQIGKQSGLGTRNEAIQQLEKMLSGEKYYSAITREILAQLSQRDQVLLSCTTVVVGENFADLAKCQKPENWAEEERVGFCLKFSAFERGRRMEDILRQWVELSEVRHRILQNAV
ncbi:hypothetical protein ONS95_014794 [Cadophora gregata]|uniref:uncharacterized protein n=1 Tax=Cadophora gregata TaxID=51156 RepID=UPI0026DC0149|nr:uncharacterized protein ONS95_014794 [Cadophora gregata]KAK0113089.1 hypothetical protein ONS95_014794 [Cadophora gregata]